MSDSPFEPGAVVTDGTCGVNDRAASAWPKVSIFDLMVWMSFSALFLALFDLGEFEGSVKLVFSAQQIAYGIVAGAQLAALLAIVRLYRLSKDDGSIWRIQPGDWLLIVPVPWLLVLMGGAVQRFLTGGNASVYRIANGSWITWVLLVSGVLTAVVWGFAFARNSGGWRLFYLMLVAHAILGSVSMMLLSTGTGNSVIWFHGVVSLISSVLSIGFVVVLVGLLFVERRSVSTRSWMHYVGVVGFLVFQLCGFLFRFVWQFLQSS